MKKRIYITLQLVAMLFLTYACTDFSDEYGYTVNISTPTVSNLRYNGDKTVSFTLTASFEKTAGELDVKEAGFSIGNGEYLQGTLTDVGVVTLDVENLVIEKGTNTSYSTYDYDIKTYIIDAETKITTSATREICYHKSDFYPLLSDYIIQLGEDSYIDVEAQADALDKVNGKPTAATFSIGNATYNMAIDDKMKVTCRVDLNKLTSSSAYQDISITVTNNAGSVSAEVGSILVSNPGVTYSDDATLSDCIRLAGYSWAKGNLQYENNTWKIADHQWDSFMSSSLNSDKLEFFSYGVITPTTYFGHSRPDSGTDIAGMSDYDVATSHLGLEWRLPSAEAFSALSSYASYFTAATDKGNVTGGYFISPDDKQIHFYSNYLRVSEELINKKGLFLPMTGFCHRYNNVAEFGSVGSAANYMSSRIMRDSYGDYYVSAFRFSFSTSSDFGLVNNRFDVYSNKFAVRPIKSNY